MVKVVGPRLAVVTMWRRDPLSFAVAEFGCAPALIGHLVVGFAG
jgi:hypothetical protein